MTDKYYRQCLLPELLVNYYVTILYNYYDNHLMPNSFVMFANDSYKLPQGHTQKDIITIDCCNQLIIFITNSLYVVITAF